MTTIRVPLIAFVLMIVIALAAFVTADTLGHRVHENTPHNAVRDFLVTGVIDHDGVDACHFLTPNALAEIRAVQPPGTTCPASMGTARLVLGGVPVTTEGEVKALTYRTQEQGHRATVTVSANGGSQTFRMRTANPAQETGFTPPPTPWRIDSGAASLIPPIIG